MAGKRPRFLNLLQIRLPLAARASILHRVSGFGLFLFLPFLLWLLQLSLESEATYQDIVRCIANPFVKLILAGLLWALLHHFCMGIRVLLIDLHIGGQKSTSQRSAIAVFVCSIGLWLFVVAKLFGGY